MVLHCHGSDKVLCLLFVGLSSALSALDVTTFEKLLAIAETFRPIDTNRDVDVYKVTGYMQL